MIEAEDVKLPNSDLMVSQVGCGTYHLGDKLDFMSAVESLEAAYRAGISLFDTSDNYQGSEAVIGKALMGSLIPRDFITIATKTGLPTSWYEAADWQAKGVKADCSPARVRTQLEKSLATMGIDEVDLYQYHKLDPSISHAEAAGTMNELIEEGKVRAWGVSNYPDEELDELMDACEAEGLILPSTTQPGHSVLNGTLRQEADKIATLVHSPLAKGLLVDDTILELKEWIEGFGPVQLAAMPERERRQILAAGEALEALDGLYEYAHSYNLSLQQFALGWVISRGAVVLTAPTRPEYLDDITVAVAAKSHLEGEDPDDLEDIRRKLFESGGLGMVLELVMGDKPYYYRVPVVS